MAVLYVYVIVNWLWLFTPPSFFSRSFVLQHQQPTRFSPLTLFILHAHILHLSLGFFFYAHGVLIEPLNNHMCNVTLALVVSLVLYQLNNIQLSRYMS